MRSENFSGDFLDNLIENLRYPEAKDYIKSYFFKVNNPVSVFMWVPSEHTFEIYDDTDVKKRFITKSKKIFENGKIKRLDQWFFDELNESYRIGFDISREKIYLKDGQLYINLFDGFPHKVDETKVFSDETKSALETILSHVREVICSNKKSEYDYLLNWIGNICIGKKNISAIYLKSGQGTGKSIFTDFLTEKVFTGIAHTTSDVSLLNPRSNNMIFRGKILVVFEELPTISKNEWEKVNSSLKSFITGKTIEFEDKWKPKVISPNVINLMLLSNVNCIKLENDDRRYVILDVSNKYVNNRPYFQKLIDAMNTVDVGHLFFTFVSEFVKKNNFKSNDIPVTISKTDNIVDNLHSSYNFIKDCYLYHNKGIDSSFRELYSDYCEYCADNKLYPASKIEFSKKLQIINVIAKKINNVATINVDFDHLYKSFVKNNWIHFLDEIEEQSNANNDIFIKFPKNEETSETPIDLIDVDSIDSVEFKKIIHTDNDLQTVIDILG